MSWSRCISCCMKRSHMYLIHIAPSSATFCCNTDLNSQLKRSLILAPPLHQKIISLSTGWDLPTWFCIQFPLLSAKITGVSPRSHFFRNEIFEKMPQCFKNSLMFYKHWIFPLFFMWLLTRKWAWTTFDHDNTCMSAVC